MGTSRAVAFALAASVATSAAAEGLYLYRVPVRVERSGALPSGQVRVRAFVGDALHLAGALDLPAEAIRGDHVVLDPLRYTVLKPSDPERFRGPSFVIDYDQSEVAALVTPPGSGAKPPAEGSLQALRLVAAGAIPQKSLERGWDVASRVAREGVGDCTEHAVLLAALARARGWPGRVVIGLALLRGREGWHALGHAWAEVHDGDQWIPLDATPLADHAPTPVYVPLVLLRDEGPGFTLGLAASIQRSWVRRLVVLEGAGR